jgi:putative SOS response-associated peptidase YedK
MCGRYSSTLPPELLARVFGTVNDLPNFPATYNLAPTQLAPVVRRHPDTGERHLDLLRWGLLPYWTKDPKQARKPINAKAETVATSGMVKAAFAKRRCLVPAGAFYEWRKLPGGGKQPFAIARADAAPLALAGIWEGWRAPSGEIERTFAIITTDANALMAPIHNRMPVVIEAPDWPAWLGEEGGDPAALLRPAGEDVLRLWPISPRVNTPRNNDAELLEPVDVQA